MCCPIGERHYLPTRRIPILISVYTINWVGINKSVEPVNSLSLPIDLYLIKCTKIQEATYRQSESQPAKSIFTDNHFKLTDVCH